MNREIKFRAWTSAGMKYNIGFHPFQNLNLKLVLPEDPHDYKYGEAFIYSPGMVEIMQFTGLLDRNGKEIYEGDILNKRIIKYYSPEESQLLPENHEPEYIDLELIVNIPNIFYLIASYTSPLEISKCEIISNIYQKK